MVKVIIGELLFDSDDSDISRERALSMFEKDSDLRTDGYKLDFSLVIDMCTPCFFL
jgi:sulfate adenylyltransferase subunit 1 (EFTu-like GTPase family)